LRLQAGEEKAALPKGRVSVLEKTSRNHRLAQKRGNAMIRTARSASEFDPAVGGAPFFLTSICPVINDTYNYTRDTIWQLINFGVFLFFATTGY
jgi:hypothetical protein